MNKENTKIKLNHGKKINEIIKLCINIIDQAIENVSDLIIFESNLERLQEYLNKLWDLRKSQKGYFSHLINTLQLILLQHKKEDFRINIIQLQVFKKILMDISSISWITNIQFKDYLKNLHKANCDIYGAFQ